MPFPDKFTGYLVRDSTSWTSFYKDEFEPRSFGDHDVDIKVECCGICATDLHTLNGSWGNTNYPLVAGHEVVGTVVRVGTAVTLVRDGQRVGIGPVCQTCRADTCRPCLGDNPGYCPRRLETYATKVPGTDLFTQGGFSSHVRAHEQLVYPIPDGLPSVAAAPLLCAGATAYSPLVRNGCGPGRKVGVVGIGGLGHLAIMFAKALGAEVWAISRTRAKEDDARRLGADGLIATLEGEGLPDEHLMSFDLIVNTANSTEGFDFPRYLSLLAVNGRWVSVGLPGGAPFPMKIHDFLANGSSAGFSLIASRRETLDMLQLAVDRNIRPWVEEVDITEEALGSALTRLSNWDVRYRFVLTGYEKQFGST